MGDHQYTAITNLVILHLSISRRFLIITGSNHLGILLEFYGLPQSCRLGNNNLWRLTTAMGAVTIAGVKTIVTSTCLIFHILMKSCLHPSRAFSHIPLECC